MEPIISLKRSHPVSFDFCVICQSSTVKDILRKSSDQGLEKIQDVTYRRKKIGDTAYIGAIDRVDSAFQSGQEATLHWHKQCYSKYTDKGKILRLQSRVEPESSGTTLKPSVLRKSVTILDWTSCMFCQKNSLKDRLIEISSLNMSKQILDLAKFDQNLQVQLAAVNDLVAEGGKYHLTCFMRLKRSAQRIKNGIQGKDIAMSWLSSELKFAADQGHVFQLNEVWDQYCELIQKSDRKVPSSFLSRRSSFKEKLEAEVGTVYSFIPSLDKSLDKMLLVPKAVNTFITVNHIENEIEEDETLSIPTYKPPDEEMFHSLVHVALKLRGDILSHPSYKGFSVSEGEAVSCIPNSLYMFLNLLCQGEGAFDDNLGGDEKEDTLRMKILSLSQDLIYLASREKKWGPKHIGLGSAIHQATRSKHLVKLFHNAGHCLSYNALLGMDTALAKSTLETMDAETGAVVPQNLVPGKFTHFTADNIDIADASLDGKNTFHATQFAAWQRGPEQYKLLNRLAFAKESTLTIPEAMENLIAVEIAEGKTEPVFPQEVKPDWYKPPEGNSDIRKADSKDLAFILKRANATPKQSWTAFNQSASKVDPPETVVGYMPIIQAPAHELDTLNTVIQRCWHISQDLGQKYVVLTVDEALYCKLMELKWAIPEYRDFLIPRLGGLHVSLNFLKTIGKHVQSSGLAEVWIESGILGPNATEQAMVGKPYARAIRAHKLTFQALWHLLLPDLLNFLQEKDFDLKNDILQAAEVDECDLLVSLLCTSRFQEQFSLYIEEKDDPNFNFWWQYLQMVSALLMFTRAQRDGLWDLHLQSFTSMLAYFIRYDHINYARWGSVYIAEMKMLPAEVLSEFRKGDFVVKMSPSKFNQVDPDHSQEWLNAIGKKGGGIVGITKTPNALKRWALSYNLRSQINISTRRLYHLELEDQLLHKEASQFRIAKDNEAEDALLASLKRCKVFQENPSTKTLQNIVTKDVATDAIQNSLLNAKKLGQVQLNTFVEQRLIKKELKLHDPLQKNKAPTFSTLYEVEKVKDKEHIIKADRSILQRLIAAYEAGRPVNLAGILQHELLPVPISLAEMNGTLRSGSKSILTEVITEGISCPPTLTITGSSNLVVDGQAVVQAIGKPSAASTFGDLADAFVNNILLSGRVFDKIDVVFDQYNRTSIKDTTRQKRTKGLHPIRRVIESRSVPLPSNWQGFLAHKENKKDLSQFLSHELMKHAPQDKVVIVAGGFGNAEEVHCSVPHSDISKLQGNHEEADTRLILHCINSNANTIVVTARDTDVLLLLVAHFEKMPSSKVWMKAGTSKKQRYIPIHDVVQKLQEEIPDLELVLPFHSLTSCDTTSYFASHGKKTAWKIFKTCPELLADVGKGEISQDIIDKAETFVCKMYGVEASSTNYCRSVLFRRCLAPDTLPPTSDALQFHIQRAHFQSLVWRQAHLPKPILPSTEGHGWLCKDGQLVPQLMSLTPVPQSCLEVISCGCRKGCISSRCKCRIAKLLCTGACKCFMHHCMNINNG